MPDPASATATETGTAAAWTIAANSTSYRDVDAGSWTSRTQPFVTGAQAAVEQRQRTAAGGSTWALIRAGSCVTRLRDLSVGVPSRDVPSGPDRRIVYVTATIALTCGTGQVRLTPFAAQLTVTRVAGRWLVTDVLH
jgi:hypothetical protein